MDTPYVREPGYAMRYRDRRFATAHGPATDRRERAALRALLPHAAADPGWWLDLPCGAGRLSDELPGAVVQADRDLAMVAACGHARPRACAAAARLPFADGAFAGVLCCRLLQHIASAAERRTILAELARVSRGPIVLSFFDAFSLTHVRRVVRRALGKNRSGRSAIRRATLTRDLAAVGLTPIRFHALARFRSEQTFVLCRRAHAH